MERPRPWRAKPLTLFLFVATVLWSHANALQGLALPVRRVELRSPEIAELFGSAPSATEAISHRLEVPVGSDVTLGLLVEATQDEPALMLTMYGTPVADDEVVSTGQHQQQLQRSLLKSPSLCDAPLCVDWMTMANLSRSMVVSIVVTSACCPDVEYLYRLLIAVDEPYPLFVFSLPPANIQAIPWEPVKFTLAYRSFPKDACSVQCDGAFITYNISYFLLGNVTLVEIQLMSRHQRNFLCYVFFRSTFGNVTALPFQFAVTSPDVPVCSSVIVGCVTSLFAGIVSAFIGKALCCEAMRLVRCQCEACVHWLTACGSKWRCLKCTNRVAAAADPPCDSADRHYSGASRHQSGGTCASSDGSSAVLPSPPHLSDVCNTSFDDVSSCGDQVMYDSPTNGRVCVYLPKLHVEQGGVLSVMVGSCNYTVVGQAEAVAEVLGTTNDSLHEIQTF